MDLQTRFNRMIDTLEKEPIKTWFDITLFLDRIIDTREKRSSLVPSTFQGFKEEIRSGIGFICFYFWIDGVSIEVQKYALALENILVDSQSGEKPGCN